MGVRKATEWIDWASLVSRADLTTARLTYDPTDQIVWFDYTDASSNSRSLAIHVGEKHWIYAPGDDYSQADALQAIAAGMSAVGGRIPKITGPHICTIKARTIGEYGSQLRHWSVDSSGVVYNERTGTGSAAMILESGWLQPSGPLEDVWFREGAVYHSNWGAGQSAPLIWLYDRKGLETNRP